MKDLTVKCSNKNCNKEYVSEFKKCPYCGAKNPMYDEDGLQLNEDDGSEKSSWYVFSNLVLIVSAVLFLISIGFSIHLRTVELFIVGIIYFVSVAFLCAIVQLLADIKQGIAKLNNKN